MKSFDFSHFPMLESDRLILRQIMLTDANGWLAVWNNEDVMRYMTDFDATPTTQDDILSIIQWADDIFAKQTGLRWALTLKSTNTMLGSIGFHLYHKNHRCAEIGYELNRQYWRKGLMFEAGVAILDFGFNQLNLHRIEANVTVGNEGSARLLRKLGFTQEGTWRDKVFNQGQFLSLWQFALLEDEYRAQL